MLALVSLFVWLLHNFIIIYSFCTNKCLNCNSKNDELGACVRYTWPSYLSLLKLFSFYSPAICTYFYSQLPHSSSVSDVLAYAVLTELFLRFALIDIKSDQWQSLQNTNLSRKKKNMFIAVMTSLKAVKLVFQAKSAPDHTEFFPFYVGAVHYM